MTPDLSRIHEIAAELERRGLTAGAGQVATISASLILSMIPIVGGPASYLVDKAGTHASEPDHAGNVLDLSRAILAIAPEIERIDSLEECLKAIAGVVRAHEEILEKFRPAIEVAATEALDTMEIANHGGLQNLVDVVIRDLRLEVETLDGGRSQFEGVDHTGPSRFVTGKDAQTTISKSVFQGRNPGGDQVTARYGAPVQASDVTVEHAGGPDAKGRYAGLRVTRII